MPGKAETEAIEAFVAERGVDAFDHAIDDDGSIWEALGVRTQPSFAFINDDGTITVFSGPMGLEGITAEIEKLQAS